MGKNKTQEHGLKISTINVQGLCSCVRALIEYNLVGKKSEFYDKCRNLIEWINLQLYDIIVLTETKLNIPLSKSLSKFIGKFYYVHFNNSQTPSAGIAILVKKKIFMKPISVDICLGNLTKMELMFINNNLPPLSVFAFYNPSPYSNNGIRIENSIVDSWEPHNGIILGDFNKIFHINDYLPASSSSSSQLYKYNRESSEMSNWLRNLNAVCIRDNRSSFTRISNKCCKNIDHILFSRDLENYVTPIRVKFPPFKTDHLIVECNLNIQFSKIKKRTTISKQVFNDLSFISDCTKEIDKILTSHGDSTSLYYKAKKYFIKRALSRQTCKRNKDLHEFKRIQKELLNFKLRGKSKDNIDFFLLQTRMNTFLQKISCDIEFSDVIFKSRRGPNAAITSLLKNKNNSIPYFVNNNGDKLFGKIGADYAANHQKMIYQNKIIIESYKNELLNKIKPIDSNACAMLEENFTEEELISASHFLKDNSPGQSGLPSLFLKKFKNPIKNLVEIGNDILNKGIAPHEMNNGIVIMLPKGEKDPKLVNNTRGITLLEVDRKLCTTAMTLRINNMLKKYPIISSNQTCHVGRNMKENILILQLLFKKFQENKDPLFALFLDFEKAFDRVDFSFLLSALEKMGFGKKFINFIKAFLKLNVNVCFQGEFSNSYETTCGVPQGEVFSPSLFIIIMDIFVKLLESKKELKGIKIGPNISIKSLHYADDSTHLFSSSKEYNTFANCIDLFSKGSNFKVSVEKSELIIFNSKETNFGDFKKSDHNVRYLGVHFNKNGLVNNFQELFNKFQNNLTKIKSTFPNFLSRIDCYKSYVQGVLYFHGTFAEFSKKEIKELDKLERWFLFSRDRVYQKNKKYSNIKLERLAQKKDEGGENLRSNWDLLCNSKAVFAIPNLINKSKNHILSHLFHYVAIKKMRTHTYNSLFHPITFHKSDLDTIPLNHSSHSFINQIISSTMHFKKNLSYKPQNNKRFVGLDISQNSIFKVGEIDYSIPTRYSKKKKIPLKCYEINEWKKTKIEFPFKVDENAIKLKTIFEERRKAENNSIIRTKNQKKWIADGIKIDDLFKINFSCLPNIKDFFRKILHNYFRTKDKKCELCNEKFDSMHLFLNCEVTKKWEIDAYGLENRNVRIYYAFKNIHPKFKNQLLYATLLNWSIWLTRNYIIHLTNNIEKENALNNAHLYLNKNIKASELNHLKFYIYKKKKYNRDDFISFMYFTISNHSNEIIEI